jgi:ATP-binding cassette, subfamily B, bacterial CvaB/MchF/RaxB
MQISSSLGLGTRAVRCELAELRQLRTPAILHWNMDHFVVLKSANSRRATILDPARGQITINLAEVSNSFTGIALEISPTREFRHRRERRSVRLSSLIQLDGAIGQAIVQGLLLSLLFQCFVLAAPYLLQVVIDQGILRLDSSVLVALVLAFVLLKIFEVCTSALRDLVLQYVANVLAFDMKAGVFRHMMRLPLSYFHRRHVGDIQLRFQSLQSVANFISNGAIAGIIDGLLAIFIAIVLLVYSPKLAVVVLGATGLYAVLRWVSIELSKRLAGDLIAAEAGESTHFLETLRSVQTLKVSAAEVMREAKWRNLSANAINGRIRVGNVNVFYSALSQAVIGFSTIMVLYIGATEIIGAQMTIGMLTAFLAYKGQLEQRVTTLIEQFVNWQLLDVHLERIADIALADAEPHLDAVGAGRSVGGRLELTDVRFRYAPHEQDVLRGVSFAVAAGEFVAVTGPSGSGKSTLVKIITGLYAPSTGGFFVDGAPIQAVGLRSLRTQIGVVMQDDVLLAGSIAENIAMFDDYISMPHVIAAAQAACIHEFIESTAMGYRTLVGDMGSALSGGQQQRIMLARALYREPKILILDEGTAHLDEQTEGAIAASVKALAMTRIIVAHRSATIAMADRIIVMADGRVRREPGLLSRL